MAALEGELWTSLEQINSNNIRKWLYGTVLVRDWDPAGSTSLAGFTLFDTKGNLRNDLFDADFPGGPWSDVGAIDANGVDFTPRYKTVDTDIWQSRLPQRTDVDGDGEDVMINMSETNPVALALFNNQPLVTVPGSTTVDNVTTANGVSALQGIGAANFEVNYSIFPQIIYRQILVIGVDGELTNPLYVAELRPRVSLTKLEKRQFNSKKPDEFGVSFGIYVDPASGFAKQAQYGGPAWLAMANEVIIPSDATVTATAGTTGATATLVFPAPLGGNFSQYNYSVVQNVSGSSTALTGTQVAQAQIDGNIVTLNLTGLTAGTSTFSVTAINGSNFSAIYPASTSALIAAGS